LLFFKEISIFKIKIIAIGKLDQKGFHIEYENYKKKISRFASIELVEVAETGGKWKNFNEVVKRDSQAVLKKIKQGESFFVFSPKGKTYDSKEFATWLNKTLENSGKVTLVIGGSHGLSSELINQAKSEISFSSLTFPHQMFRVMALEQIYRSFKINAGEKYHK